MRRKNSHKGDFGHLLVIAGDAVRLGAGYLSSLAAFRCGVGLVTYAMPREAYRRFDARYPEVMPLSVPDDGKGHFNLDSFKFLRGRINDYDAVVLGPAIGTERCTVNFVERLLGEVKIPILCDADALNALAILKLKPLLRSGLSSFNIVLTPHAGEMGRLIGISSSRVQRDRLKVAKDFVKRFDQILVLKGHKTIVAGSGKGLYINPTGNPGMATAGMGDVLSGMIGSFLAQGLKPFDAGILGVYLHGMAGDFAAKIKGEISLIASDLIEKIPDSLKKMIAK